MPSQIAHILLGIQAADGLPRGWLDRFWAPAFHLGCQGPDVFYHNRRTTPGGFLYGTRLHRRGWGEFLSRFRREALNRGWEPGHPGLAFLAGQATHGFLDRSAHPFIVYFSGWRIPGHPETSHLRHAHAFLERVLDVLLWRERVATPWSACRWQEETPGVADFPGDFWTAWADALHPVFPRLSARSEVELRLKNAIADTQGFLRATAPGARDLAVRAAREGGLHWFHPEALPDEDFLNLGHGPWLDPVTGGTRTESFLDLFDRATEEARGALSTLGDPSVDWEPLMGNGSLNLPGSEGENSAPRFSRPWDFRALYELERNHRLGRVGAPPSRASPPGLP